MRTEAKETQLKFTSVRFYKIRLLQLFTLYSFTCLILFEDDFEDLFLDDKSSSLVPVFIIVIVNIVITRKYPLCRYILGVLMHTTAWDQHWGSDETLK